MELGPREKQVLKIRQDVETKPNEVNVQSTGFTEEEQGFFTEKDNETEEEILERKKQFKTGLKVPDTVIQIEAISEKKVDEITIVTQKLRGTKSFCSNQRSNFTSIKS